jgi:hypothetical protein
MRAAALLVPLLVAAACGPAGKTAKTGNDDKFDADAKSGPDGKRSTAREVKINTAVTDEVSFAGQDKTDWYLVRLLGKAGVLNTVVHWDADSSDVQIDVFDELGRQISASPVRNRGAKEKSLLTQIDKPGVYYVRVTAPTKADATVYTMEAKWDAPAPVAVKEPPPAREHVEPVAEDPPPRHHHEREPREPRGGETVQGRIVQAYLESGALTLHLDKGASAGLKPGMTGTVLSGASGEDALDGGTFRIVSVLDANKSVARCSLRSLGKNTRVLITLGK